MRIDGILKNAQSVIVGRMLTTHSKTNTLWFWITDLTTTTKAFWATNKIITRLEWLRILKSLRSSWFLSEKSTSKGVPSKTTTKIYRPITEALCSINITRVRSILAARSSETKLLTPHLTEEPTEAMSKWQEEIWPTSNRFRKDWKESTKEILTE